ncbi:MAG: hypothetical protein GYA24_07200 [Candidatus Lokiarchaeota archaeon]|nr:hypothetical protein [Candidatus Lokiarchaeota archaeon]
MADESRIDTEIDYDTELAKDIRRHLKFYLKELEHFSEPAHVKAVLEEIACLASTCPDEKIKAFISRKLEDLLRQFPDLA